MRLVNRIHAVIMGVTLVGLGCLQAGYGQVQGPSFQGTNASAVNYFLGNTGVGPTNPAAKFHVTGAAGNWGGFSAGAAFVVPDENSWVLVYANQSAGLGNFVGNFFWNTGQFTFGTPADWNILAIDPAYNNIGLGLYQPNSGARVEIVPQSAAHIPLMVRGVGAQTANLQEWRSDGGVPLTVVDEAGYVGIGTNNPSTPLYVYGKATIRSNLNMVGSSITNAVLGQGVSYQGNAIATNYIAAGFLPSSQATAYVSTNDGRVVALPQQNRMSNVWVSATGAVGIGTNAPGATFQVATPSGISPKLATFSWSAVDLFTLGKSASVPYMQICDTTGVARAYIAGKDDASSYLFSRLGLGTTSPSCALDIRVQDTLPAYALLIANTNGNVYAGHYINSNGVPQFYMFYPAGTSKILLNTDGASYLLGGNLGIGTNSPQAMLHVAGAARFDQGITYVPQLGDISMGVYTNDP